uniref:Uncharacterized protein n=1 Tax=Physcomitrium patens TaxID=3218 RepID=A0A2K1JMQ0_PHYPA|nr:hypothetical protein PHYPA_017651 [Physcomitrium patens]
MILMQLKCFCKKLRRGNPGAPVDEMLNLNASRVTVLFRRQWVVYVIGRSADGSRCSLEILRNLYFIWNCYTLHHHRSVSSLVRSSIVTLQHSSSSYSEEFTLSMSSKRE